MSTENNQDKKKALDAALNKLEKQFGKGSIMRMGDKPNMEVESISTGSLNLDIALGVGGLPRGRIIEIYGPESCLAADTYIQYELRNIETGDRINHKGGTIENLYERYHDIATDGRAKKLDRDNIAFYVSSIDENNCIIKQPVADVKKCGVKMCYRLTTASGHMIDATEDHRFYVGNGEYKKLKDLTVGEEVFVHSNTPNTKEHEPRVAYKECLVKYHPSKKYKTVNAKNKDGEITSSFVYCRVFEHVLVAEAMLNGLTLEEYVNILNTGNAEVIDKMVILDTNFVDVHHIDTNERNNDIRNLQILPKTIHYSVHAKSNLQNLSFVVTPTEIISIEEIGERETYDIKCFAPYNNYIANGIAVHNCGKSTLAMHCVAEVQKAGGTACYIDAEHAMDPSYAESIGVNTDELLIAQPSSGEEGLEICDTMVRSGCCDIVIVDSVAALVPQAELDGEMGDAVVGLQARLLSQAMRKLTASISKSKCVVIFINQLRMKIGVMYGNPETTPGGNALKFYSSVRMDIRRVEAIKKGTEVIGNHVRVKVVKNKVAPPFREAEFDIIFGKGISKDGEIVDAAVNLGIIQKGGAWFSYANEETGRNERWQGRDKVKEALLADEELKNEIEQMVLSALKR